MNKVLLPSLPWAAPSCPCKLLTSLLLLSAWNLILQIRLGLLIRLPDLLLLSLELLLLLLVVLVLLLLPDVLGGVVDGLL